MRSDTVEPAGPAPYAYRIALLSGLMGFLIGALVVPEWQDAVETGQVLSGEVYYPLDNPFYIYNVKLWTLACQAAALGLTAGIEEHVLSIVFSGFWERRISRASH